MATLTENAQWEDGVYQLERTDRVLAGADGIVNVPFSQLANRTKFLKQETDNLALDVQSKFETLKAMLDLVAKTASEALESARKANNRVLAAALDIANLALRHQKDINWQADHNNALLNYMTDAWNQMGGKVSVATALPVSGQLVAPGAYACPVIFLEEGAVVPEGARFVINADSVVNGQCQISLSL